MPCRTPPLSPTKTGHSGAVILNSKRCDSASPFPTLNVRGGTVTGHTCGVAGARRSSAYSSPSKRTCQREMKSAVPTTVLQFTNVRKRVKCLMSPTSLRPRNSGTLVASPRPPVRRRARGRAHAGKQGRIDRTPPARTQCPRYYAQGKP